MLSEHLRSSKQWLGSTPLTRPLERICHLPFSCNWRQVNKLDIGKKKLRWYDLKTSLVPVLKGKKMVKLKIDLLNSNTVISEREFSFNFCLKQKFIVNPEINDHKLSLSIPLKMFPDVWTWSVVYYLIVIDIEEKNVKKRHRDCHFLMIYH